MDGYLVTWKGRNGTEERRLKPLKWKKEKEKEKEKERRAPTAERVLNSSAS